MATTTLIQRVVEVKQADGTILTDGNDLAAWAKRFEFASALDLIAEMDAVDGGVETDIEIECPHCGNIMDVEIPFDGGTFWVPRNRSVPKSGRADV